MKSIIRLAAVLMGLLAGSAMAQHQLAFTTTPQTVISEPCSSIVTIQSQDLSGNPYNVPAATVVTLSSPNSSTIRFFSASTCYDLYPTSQITTVTIPANTSTVSFYFWDTASNYQPTINATATGFNFGQQTETVNNPYGGLTTQTYYINASSFTSLGVPDPTTAIRASTATLQWAYGSRVRFVYGGTTTNTASCPTLSSDAKNVVVMYAGSKSGATNTTEETTYCNYRGASFWIVKLWQSPTGCSGTCVWKTHAQTSATERDLGTAVLKQMFRQITSVNGNAYYSCLSNMASNPSSNAALRDLRVNPSVCEDDDKRGGSYVNSRGDFENMAGKPLTGMPYGHLRQTLTAQVSTQWPNPTDLTWSALTPTLTTVDLGAGLLGRPTWSGNPTYMLGHRADFWPHTVASWTPFTSSSPTNLPVSSANYLGDPDSALFISTAFDTSRNILWALDSSGLIWTNDGTHGWYVLGVLKGSDQQGNPVGLNAKWATVVYEPNADEMLFITSTSSSHDPPCSVDPLLQSACEGDILIYYGDATQGVYGATYYPVPFNMPAKIYTSNVTPPQSSMPVAAYCNTNISVTSGRPDCEMVWVDANDLSVKSWPFKGYDLSQTALLSGAITNLGGTSLYPPSVTSNGPNNTGYNVALVTGTDGCLYKNQKSSLGGAWSGWQGFGFICSVWNRANLQINEAAQNYQVVYGQ